MNEPDPELLNNEGIDLLESGDVAGAERLFRQAVALQPKRWLFRNNLFFALRFRSRLYGLLTLPGRGVDAVGQLMRKHRWTFYLCVFIVVVSVRLIMNVKVIDPAWIYAAPGLLILAWLVFFWPLTRFYEFLVVREIQAESSRNPIRGVPFGVKFFLFVILMMGLWTALGFGIADEKIRPYAIGAVVAWILPFVISGWIRKWREKRRQKERKQEAVEKLKRYHRRA